MGVVRNLRGVPPPAEEKPYQRARDFSVFITPELKGWAQLLKAGTLKDPQGTATMITGNANVNPSRRSCVAPKTPSNAGRFSDRFSICSTAERVSSNPSVRPHHSSRSEGKRGTLSPRLAGASGPSGVASPRASGIRIVQHKSDKSEKIIKKMSSTRGLGKRGTLSPGYLDSGQVSVWDKEEVSSSSVNVAGWLRLDTMTTEVPRIDSQSSNAGAQSSNASSNITSEGPSVQLRGGGETETFVSIDSNPTVHIFSSAS